MLFPIPQLLRAIDDPSMTGEETLGILLHWLEQTENFRREPVDQPRTITELREHLQHLEQCWPRAVGAREFERTGKVPEPSMYGMSSTRVRAHLRRYKGQLPPELQLIGAIQWQSWCAQASQAMQELWSRLT